MIGKAIIKLSDYHRETNQNNDFEMELSNYLKNKLIDKSNLASDRAIRCSNSELQKSLTGQA